jgi:Tfp pilus assembly protein PilX
MSTGAIVAIITIIVIVLIVVALILGSRAALRRRRLRERFGPEYERAVAEHDSQRKAEAALARRERRVRGLDIRPLSQAARAQYSSEWTAVQEQFVDAPQAAVTGAQTLVAAVMKDRGYPHQSYDQTLADLSVEHASALGHFRTAHEISQNAASGEASTEDLRQALIHYRALFTELLGQPSADADVRSAGPREEAAAAGNVAGPAPGELDERAIDGPDADLDLDPDRHPDPDPDPDPDADPDLHPDRHPDPGPDADPDLHPDAGRVVTSRPQVR